MAVLQQAKEGLGDTDVLPAAVLKQLEEDPGSVKLDDLKVLCVKQLKVLSSNADENKAKCSE
jgi:hypothetical protein